ncbi:hypothetical protein BDV12DRAFT_50402 [Aspergillus spectabilis]
MVVQASQPNTTSLLAYSFFFSLKQLFKNSTLNLLILLAITMKIDFLLNPPLSHHATSNTPSQESNDPNMEFGQLVQWQQSLKAELMSRFELGQHTTTSDAERLQQLLNQGLAILEQQAFQAVVSQVSAEVFTYQHGLMQRIQDCGVEDLLQELKGLLPVIRSIRESNKLRPHLLFNITTAPEFLEDIKKEDEILCEESDKLDLKMKLAWDRLEKSKERLNQAKASLQDMLEILSEKERWIPTLYKLQGVLQTFTAFDLLLEETTTETTKLRAHLVQKQEELSNLQTEIKNLDKQLQVTREKVFPESPGSPEDRNRPPINTAFSRTLPEEPLDPTDSIQQERNAEAATDSGDSTRS